MQFRPTRPWLLLTLCTAAWCDRTRAQTVPAPNGVDWGAARAAYGYQRPDRHQLPSVRNRLWPRQPVDWFVLDRVERAGLSPAPQASRRTLIRRLSFDLTGLPPQPSDVDAFLADPRPDAYEALVERLLASPHFGERMASMWLPLMRYAEDQAHQVGTDTKFFYPHAYKYREWVIGAFNRDLGYDRFIQLQLAADLQPNLSAADQVALGFLGLGPKYYNRSRIEVMSDEWEDGVDTTTRSLLGLTVACARCHDHKFEPITTHDYYALAGVFASTKLTNKRIGSSQDSADESELQAEKMHADTLHIVEDGDVRDLTIFVRGNVAQPGPVVPRRFLRILCDGEPATFAHGSGRRELAAAITNRDNPLTARVFVNRVWAILFGQPLVATPSNFGRSGRPPTHPELLDDLAVRFMDNGWSIKSLVRELVRSTTYRQQSRGGTDDAAIDAPNTLLSRMNRKRLTIEQWRDAVLFVANHLESGGGPSQELDDVRNHRRSVYSRVSRLKLNDMFLLFDYPDANVHAERRVVSTTPMQQLQMLNGPFILAQSQSVARRLTASIDGTAARVRQAYWLLFGRAPEHPELELAIEFITGADEESRWAQFAQILLVSNEMLYID